MAIYQKIYLVVHPMLSPKICPVRGPSGVNFFKNAFVIPLSSKDLKLLEIMICFTNVLIENIIYFS